MRSKGYVLPAAALGALVGGTVVVIVTQAIPKMMSKMMGGDDAEHDGSHAGRGLRPGGDVTAHAGGLRRSPMSVYAV